MSELVPEGWFDYTIEAICDVIGGGTPDRANIEFWGGDIPWISPTEIVKLKSRYIGKTKECITSSGLNGSSAKLHPAGTVLMTSRASIGFAAINTIPMATNQGFQSFRCKKFISNEYLYQLIQSKQNELARLAAGSTFLEISSANVKKLKITIPPLPEQQKIATILTSVDDVIEKTEAQINKLQDLKKGMMQELLTKGVGTNGVPHTEFKDSPVGRIPKGWEVEGIYDSCNEVFLGLTAKVDYVEKGGVPLVRATDISRGSLSFSKAKFISEEQHKSLTKYRQAKRGDVLISKSGSLGVCATVDTDREFSIYESIIVLQPKAALLCSRYLLWLMRASETQRRLLGGTVGSTVGHLNLGDFRKLKIPLPPLVEQRQIATTLEGIDKECSLTQTKLYSLKSLKKALMQDLLTGKVRVKINQNEKEAVMG